MALTNKLTAIGDAIRNKTGSTNLMTLDEMPTAIESIEGGGGGGADLPAEAFKLTGSCQYRFAYNTWNWFIENYGDRVVTEGLTDLGNMFYYSDKLEEIPFELNCVNGALNKINLENLFFRCNELKHIPKVNAKVGSFAQVFSYCSNIREITQEDISGLDFNTTDMDLNTSGAYKGGMDKIFQNCSSLRSFPMELLNHGNPLCTYGDSVYNYTFSGCAALDEVVGMPFPHTATWTSNALNNMISNCHRLKRFTFAMQEDGSPYVMNWKSQVLDCTSLGKVPNSGDILNYNSGITEETKVMTIDDYHRLKDHPDWWCIDDKFARYNRLSAVETINSLPDTSAYLASSGGTNTIKFSTTRGSATDGGACVDLTEEDIAVAAARGWTVTLV